MRISGGRSLYNVYGSSTIILYIIIILLALYQDDKSKYLGFPAVSATFRNNKHSIFVIKLEMHYYNKYVCCWVEGYVHFNTLHYIE